MCSCSLIYVSKNNVVSCLRAESRAICFTISYLSIYYFISIYLST